MAERPLRRVDLALREARDPLGLLVALVAGAAAWVLHVPGPVAVGVVVAVLAVKIVAGWLLPVPKQPVPPAIAIRGPLTRREWEISELVADGLTNREMATRLFITEASVDTHLAHVREKLGFHTRAEVARWVTERRQQGEARK